MARIALDLSQFKSAGVYTVEIDNTERILVTTQTLRLVPGFSARGPFNTPVFIRSNRDLEKFYGTLDAKLERKGSFFHRSIQTCLLTSPVLAISLLKTDDTSLGDKAEYIALGLDSSAAESAALYDDANEDLYINFFNRTRFWTPDPENLQRVVANSTTYNADGDIEQAPLIQFANIGTKKISFIVRKAQSLNQYSVYAKDWYGSDTNIPYEWIRPYDLMKDYFIEVIAIEGDWTNYAQLSSDPYYSQFFTANGIITTKVQNFLSTSNVSLIGSWVGTIIPDFVDQKGTEQYIETIINNTTPFTGILMNINHQALDQLNWDSTNSLWVLGEETDAAPFTVDLVGHNLIDQTDISTRFLSYELNVAGETFYTEVSIGALDSTSRSFYVVDSSSLRSYDAFSVGSLVKKDPAGIIPGVTYVMTKTYDNSWGYKFTTAEALSVTTVGDAIFQKTIDDPSVCSYYKMFKLDGLTLSNKHMPGFDTAGARDAEAGVEKIYGMLDDLGIKRGLINTDMLSYRYIVDTMAYGLEDQMGGKKWLSKTAKARGKCTAILNAPSISHFGSSTDPYFCDTFDTLTEAAPVFSTEWIPQGGNPNLPRSFRFTFPNEENGSKYCGVFGPFLKYIVGGKTTMVPPAADVANAYVRKFLGGDPYAVVANRNGILSNPNLAGIEYMIDKTDRDFLEPFGYNSIIERPTTGQVMIYANSTAFQDVKSDFNNLHVRELLNTIEIQIDEQLQPYIFTFNNSITRLNIINSITAILEPIKDSGALVKYEVVMDETNNPEEVIAEGFGIVDINIWVTDVLTKIVNRITLNKNTGTSTGGFIF